MVAQWGDISSSDDFQNASPDTQEAVRQRYFNNVVAKDESYTSLDAANQKAVRDRFYTNTIQKDWQNNTFTTQDAQSRLESYGLDKSAAGGGSGLFGDYSTAMGMPKNLADVKSEGKAALAGATRGVENIAGGIGKVAASAERYAGLLTPEQEQQAYTNITNATTQLNPETKEEKEHPMISGAAEFAPSAVAFSATAPEIAPIKGAGMLENVGKAALMSTPSAGLTAGAISNAPTPESKLKTGLWTAILNPLVVTGAAYTAKALQAGQYATQWFMDHFTQSGNDRNVLKNILNTSYGGTDQASQGAFENEVRDLQGQTPNGVQMPTTAIAGVKPVAQDTGAKVGAELKQKELTAQTQTTENLQNQFAAPNEQGLKTGVNTAINSGAAAERAIPGQIQAKPSSGEISTQENAKMLGATKALGEERNAAYKAALEAGNNIKSNPDEVGSALGQLKDISLLNKYQTRDSNLGVVFDKDSGQALTDTNGKVLLQKTPTLTDINEVNSRISDDLNKVLEGKSTRNLVTDQDVEDAKHLQDALNDMKERIISREAQANPEMDKVLRPEKYANEKFYSYFKGENPATATPSPETGEIAKSNSADFFENALGEWRNNRNGPNAVEASQTLEKYFDKANPSDIQALFKLRPGSEKTMEDYFSQRALEEGLSGGKFNPDAVEKYLNARSDTIGALPQANQQGIVRNTKFFIDAARDARIPQDQLGDFAKWASGQESNAVFDSSLKNVNALKDLYDKFSTITSVGNNKQALDDLLKNKFIQLNTKSEKIPFTQGANPKFQQVSTIDPKVVNEIVTKQGSNYEVAKALYGKDMDTVSSSMELLNNLQKDIANVKPTEGTEQSKLTEELAKGPFFIAGTRYGVVSTGARVWKYVLGQGGKAAQLRVLGDINYARKVLDSFNERDFSGLEKLLSENLTNLGKDASIVSGQLGGKVNEEDDNNNNNSPNATNKSGSIVPRYYKE